MIRFGDYQFGGHRYFSNEHPTLNQRLCSPKDCANAKGTYNNLTEGQIICINTTSLRDAYQNHENGYDYTPVTSSFDEILDY